MRQVGHGDSLNFSPHHRGWFIEVISREWGNEPGDLYVFNQESHKGG